MSIITATVVRVDRSTTTCTARIDGPERPDISYDPARPPVPLMHHRFERVGTTAYRCLGPVGNVTRLCHDHFLQAGTAYPDFGDGSWIDFSPGGGTPVVFSVGGEAIGSLRVDADISFGIQSRGGIAKDTQSCRVQAPNGLHFLASVRADMVNDADSTLEVGITEAISSTLGSGVSFRNDPTSGRWLFTSSDGAIEETIVEGVEYTGLEFTEFEIVAVPGSFSAGWVNGDGPYVLTTNTLTAASGFSPFFLINAQPSAAVTPGFLIDYVTFNAVSPVRSPVLYAEAV